MSSYPPVFEVLGAVSDKSLRYEAEAQVRLRRDSAVLRESAGALQRHLYGQAGLLETLETTLCCTQRGKRVFATGMAMRPG